MFEEQKSSAADTAAGDGTAGPGSVLFSSGQTVEPLITHTPVEEPMDPEPSNLPGDPQLPDPLKTPELGDPLRAPALADPLAKPELPDPLSQPELPPATPPHRSDIRPATGLWLPVVYGVLLLLGIGLGLGIKQRIGDTAGSAIPQTPAPTVAMGASASPTPTSPYGGWAPQRVLNGRTKQPIPGITFRLPSGVIALSCDGDACASQGTYLPGGTRFTVAARGAEQILPDFRGAEISDVNGKAFISTPIAVDGQTATAFRGEFTGTTVGGYTFAEMRGVMIPLGTGLSVEINHFSPQGVATNFIADDALFDQILQSIDIDMTSVSASGTATVSATPLP